MSLLRQCHLPQRLVIECPSQEGPSQECSWPGRKLGGFTLVELLVVISIVALLAAALVPAVFKSIEKAKTARIGIELASIESALERYKQEMGEFPPDFSELAECTTTDSRVQAAMAIINGHMARKYRRRNITLTSLGDWPVDSNGNFHPNALQVLAELNPTNALAFWLHGFSDDPARPLFGAGTRQPFFEFDQARLAEGVAVNAFRNDSGVAVPYVMTATYAPQGVLDARPYIYYRASFEANTVISGNSVPSANAVLSQLMLANGRPPSTTEAYRGYLGATMWAQSINAGGSLPYQVPLPYYSYAPDTSGTPPNATSLFDGGTLPNPSGSANLRSQIGQFFPYASPKKFQLITTGLDGVFGQGGDWSTGIGNVQAANFAQADRKNITNFSSGQSLEDLEDE